MCIAFYFGLIICIIPLKWDDCVKKKMFLSLMVIVSLFIITGCSNKENYITDYEHLYDTAVQYSIDNINQKSSCGSDKKYKQCHGK